MSKQLITVTKGRGAYYTVTIFTTYATGFKKEVLYTRNATHYLKKGGYIN